jgi:putative endonuclease
MPPTSRQRAGRLGEEAAVRWYLAHGFGLVARNWRCRAGELDVIVRRGRLVVFCEVKSRSGPRFGAPEEAVTRSQQRRIRAAAAAFLHVMRTDPGWAKPARVRFDVVCVRPGPSGLSVSVVEEAF